jgi:hypothetical protein
VVIAPQFTHKHTVTQLSPDPDGCIFSNASNFSELIVMSGLIDPKVQMPGTDSTGVLSVCLLEWRFLEINRSRSISIIVFFMCWIFANPSKS